MIMHRPTQSIALISILRTSAPRTHRRHAKRKIGSRRAHQRRRFDVHTLFDVVCDVYSNVRVQGERAQWSARRSRTPHVRTHQSSLSSSSSSPSLPSSTLASSFTIVALHVAHVVSHITGTGTGTAAAVAAAVLATTGWTTHAHTSLTYRSASCVRTNFFFVVRHVVHNRNSSQYSHSIHPEQLLRHEAPQPPAQINNSRTQPVRRQRAAHRRSMKCANNHHTHACTRTLLCCSPAPALSRGLADNALAFDVAVSPCSHQSRQRLLCRRQRLAAPTACARRVALPSLTRLDAPVFQTAASVVADHVAVAAPVLPHRHVVGGRVGQCSRAAATRDEHAIDITCW